MLVVFPLQSLTSWTSDSVSSWTGDCVTMLITNSVVFVAMHVCSPVLLTFSLKWNLYNSFVAYGNSYCPMVLLYGAKRAWPWLLMYLVIYSSMRASYIQQTQSLYSIELVPSDYFVAVWIFYWPLAVQWNPACHCRNPWIPGNRVWKHWCSHM